MIKTLRTSGGGYNSLDNAIIGFRNDASSEVGISEDWVLHIEPGTIWNIGDLEIYGDYVDPFGGMLTFNGHSLIFKTSPDGPGTTPARINMGRVTLGGDIIDNGNFELQ